MTECPIFYADFATATDNFVGSAKWGELKRMLPGGILSLGDCFFPVVLELDRKFSIIQIESAASEPASLCFANMHIAGYKGGDEHLYSLEEYAECSQSSFYPHEKDPIGALTGGVFSNNIHTEKEENPWWKARFSDGVLPKFIFFYRRTDIAVINEKPLRIVGYNDGEEPTVLYEPQNATLQRPRIEATLSQSLLSLQELRGQLEGKDQQAYDALLAAAFAELQACYGQYETMEHTGLWAKSKNAVAAFFTSAGPAKNEAPVTDIPLEKRHGIAGKVLDALDMAMGGAKDFGYAPETALEVKLGGVKTRQIRLRVYGEVPPGMGGLELFSAEAQDVPLKKWDRKELKFLYKPPAVNCVKSYQLGLHTAIHSRVIDLGDVHSLSHLRIWNLNRQHASNTLFLEISVRETEEDDWQLVHDQAVVYRRVCAALKLVDCVLGTRRWTPKYPWLLGKLFTQYRRRRMMQPLARLTRNDPELNDAVFDGSNEIATKVRHAVPLKLGKHGLQVPLIYRDEKLVMDYLTRVCSEVKAVGHTPLLMYGTLLGAIREKDFIPHDDDLDVAVIMQGVGPDDLQAEQEKLVEALNERGLKCNASTYPTLIHCRANSIVIDLFILGCQGDTVYWPHTALEIKPERADIFLPSGKLEFKGAEFDVPRDPEAVSEARYGPDWRTPIQSFEW